MPSFPKEISPNAFKVKTPLSVPSLRTKVDCMKSNYGLLGFLGFRRYSFFLPLSDKGDYIHGLDSFVHFIWEIEINIPNSLPVCFRSRFFKGEVKFYPNFQFWWGDSMWSVMNIIFTWHPSTLHLHPLKSFKDVIGDWSWRTIAHGWNLELGSTASRMLDFNYSKDGWWSLEIPVSALHQETKAKLSWKQIRCYYHK